MFSVNTSLQETWRIAYTCTGTLTQVNGLHSNKTSYFKLSGSFPSYSILPNQHKKLSYMGLEGINCTENCNRHKKINHVLLHYLILKDKGKVVPVHAMKAYRRCTNTDSLLLTLALNGGKQTTSHPSCFTPIKNLVIP